MNFIFNNDQECRCPYCNETQFEGFFVTQHDPYEIRECQCCGKRFGVKISTKTVFVYETEKLLTK